jgi:universal stress protein E
MQVIRKILVAVKNPDARSQPGVDKAVQVAKMLGASIELFHAISTPVFMEVEPLAGRSLAQIKSESLALRQKRLEKLGARARKRGVTASCAVEWDFPPYEAIVRRAAKTHPHLVIAECHQGQRLKPWLVHLTDWELLRTSPVPVLLLKNAKPWRKPVVLAAVDPAHTHAKPARLDAQIVAQAVQLSHVLKGSLQVMHANYPSLVGLTLGDPALDAAMLAATYEQLKAEDARVFTAFAEKARIPRARRRLLNGDPVQRIPDAARKLGASLVVMGAVSRSGLKRVFIGNTAERVLSALPCDVLVLKPEHFKTRVVPKVRGMRIVAPPPVVPLPI